MRHQRKQCGSRSERASIVAEREHRWQAERRRQLREQRDWDAYLESLYEDMLYADREGQGY